MNYDEEDLYTIEIYDDNQVSDNPDYYGIPDDEAAFTEAEEQKPFELFEENRKLTAEEKHREFLRLRDSITRMNKGPLNNGFLSQAKEFENTEIEEATPVHFTCYWPTYDAMSFSQKSWYFYWRGQVRKGKYPKTDLSYIFTYIYELINEVGTQDSRDGFLKLCSVWGGYRDSYQALDRYMTIWIEDYIQINFKSGLPQDLLTDIEHPALVNFLPEYIILDYIFGTGISALNNIFTLDYIGRFSNYKFSSGKFCQSKFGYLMYENVPLVFKYLNDYISEKSGKSIIETYKVQSSRIIKRMPYQNAVYQGKVRSVGIQIYDLKKNKAFQIFTASVIRQSENVLREITGYKGKLTVYISDEYSYIIRKCLTDKIKKEQAEKQAKIEIDRDKIKQLIRHSDEVRDKLLDGLGDFNDNNVLLNDKEILTDKNFNSDTDVKQNAQEEIGTTELFDKLSETQKNILEFIIGNGSEVSHTALAAEFQGIFTELEIDAINEYAIESLGDILLIIEDDIIKVQEF